MSARARTRAKLFSLSLFVRPAVAIAAGAALAAAPARVAEAQGGGPELRVTASTTRAEVGEPFQIELVALAERGEVVPSDPKIKPPRGISITGQAMSSQTYAQLGGGRPSVKTGFSITWELTGSAPGNYTIPAPTVTWNGKRIAAKPIAIEIVPASGRPRPQRQPFDPFSMFQGRRGGSLLPWPIGKDPFGGIEEEWELDDPGPPELQLPRAPDPVVFLRAVADKTNAVVGEQVTVTFYVYHMTTRLEKDEVHTAPLSDFVRVPLLKNPGADPVQRTRIEGQAYSVQVLDRVALFPVRAGELHTGSMSMRFTGPRVGRRALRESNDIVVRVTEPPKAGRPPAYTLGDVGRFVLSATVQPRRVEQGGAVSVALKVSGTGNLPQSLRVPARTGVEWLDPEKREHIEPQAGIVAGWRSFGYVVRLLESGEVDLGTVELPYWDPEQRRYAIARAELGTVEVTPSAAPAGSATQGSSSARPPASEPEAEPRLFEALPKARRELGAYEAPRAGPFEGARFWWMVAAPPSLVGLVSIGSRGLRLARARRAASKGSPEALAARALDDARDAEARGSVQDLAAAIERAVHHAIEAGTGLKARGVLQDELAAALEERGVDAVRAKRAAELLARCERARFDPTASGAAELRDLRDEAELVVRAIAKSG